MSLRFAPICEWQVHAPCGIGLVVLRLRFSPLACFRVEAVIRQGMFGPVEVMERFRSENCRFEAWPLEEEVAPSFLLSTGKGGRPPSGPRLRFSCTEPLQPKFVQ